MTNQNHRNGQKNIENLRNCTIDFLRLLFSILVVAIHTSPLLEYNELISYFYSQTISRPAVPFFSAVAGYFFFMRPERQYLKTILKYFIIYSFWSILMFIYDAIRWQGQPVSFVLYILKTFFLTGWHHYWYLLAIIYTMVLLAIANRITKKANDIFYYASFALLIIGIAVSNYGNVLGGLPILSFFKDHSQDLITNGLVLVFPFFMMGYKLSIKKTGLSLRKPLLIAIACTIGLLIEIVLTTVFNLHSNVVLCLFTYPTVYFLLVWALQNPYPRLQKGAKYCSGIASVIYLGHFVIALYMQSIRCPETITFLVSTLIPAMIGLILTLINKPIIRKIL